MKTVALGFAVVFSLTSCDVAFAFAQRGGFSQREATSSTILDKYQIPGLPRLTEADCQNLRTLEIPVSGDSEMARVRILSKRAAALHRMLCRLTKDDHPVRYDADKDEIVVVVSDDFGTAGSLQLPLCHNGPSPKKTRVQMDLPGQVERLVVAALLDRMPAMGRPPVKIIDPDNGNGVEISNQEILKKLDVIRALHGGASLCDYSRVILLDIRKMSLRLQVSTYPALEYRINKDAIPEQEVTRIINAFYRLRVQPLLGAN